MWVPVLKLVEARHAAQNDEDGDPLFVFRVLELVKKLPLVWVTATPARRREILEIVGSNSVLSAGKLRLAWKWPFGLLAKRPESEGWWAILDSNQ